MIKTGTSSVTTTTIEKNVKSDTCNYVFVRNNKDEPLMPTTQRKARLLLKINKATIYCYEPFTIQLKYGSSGYKQPLTLGIDAGYLNIGYSVCCSNSKRELYGGEIKLLKNIN